MSTSLKLSALLVLAIGGINTTTLHAQSSSLAARMAATIIEKPAPPNWTYDQGVMLEGIDALWRRTGNAAYYEYEQKCMDAFISDDGGTIKSYKPENYNIDNIKNGRTVLTLYKVTMKPKYFKAASLLWDQLQKQPRTKEGGFWHKQIYNNQMWLDGLYMGQPFYAEYAALTHNDRAFDDIANQFIWMEKHARDLKTGLLYHGWDESKQQQWANPKTGTSPHFWGRAIGWYAMALVDVLDNFPSDHPQRKELLAILGRVAKAVQRYQDPKSGVWYDIMDLASRKGNYLESSASSMFVYALQKGVRKGYLTADYAEVAKRGYLGIQKEFIEENGPDKVNLKGTVTVSGLGGKPYRDGSFEYYMKEKVITNDFKGMGAFLLAANEMEMAATPKTAAGKTVMLDGFFNSEKRTDQSGKEINWHYKWDELDNGGFSFWGQLFESRGFQTKTLTVSPTVNNLKQSSVYIIVDPDIPKENPNPNYISPEAIQNITEWVKLGGVLILMGNDTGNVEFDHFNQLAANFGIQFNKTSKGRVINNRFEMGKLAIPTGNPIFENVQQIYVKEYSSLKLSSPASAVLKDAEGDNVMAVSKLGIGTVYVIGDPWLYNEYVEGRKIPAIYQNFQAAEDLTDWISKQVAMVK